jgi:hypothetical protein
MPRTSGKKYIGTHALPDVEFSPTKNNPAGLAGHSTIEAAGRVPKIFLRLSLGGLGKDFSADHGEHSVPSSG